MLQMHAESDSYGNSSYLSTQLPTHRSLFDVTPVFIFTHCDSLKYVACRRHSHEFHTNTMPDADFPVICEYLVTRKFGRTKP